MEDTHSFVASASTPISLEVNYEHKVFLSTLNTSIKLRDEISICPNKMCSLNVIWASLLSTAQLHSFDYDVKMAM